MSDFLINILFDSMEDVYGKNEHTIEYVDGTFIPQYYIYKKFWISPSHQYTTLYIDRSRFQDKGIDLVDGKYSGLIKKETKYPPTLNNIPEVVNEHGFYINRIVYNNFDTFNNNFHTFKKNILIYFNSVCYIRDHKLCRESDLPLLKEFIYGCSNIFEYIENFNYSTTSFDEKILNLVDSLKEKIPDLNGIIWNSKINIEQILSDAELVLITDYYNNSRLENVDIWNIEGRTIDILSNKITSFELHNSKFENVLFNSRSNCDLYFFENNTIENINIKSAKFDNVLSFRGNKIHILNTLPYSNKYEFVDNKLSNLAYKTLTELFKEIKYNGNVQTDEVLIYPDSKNYLNYKNNFDVCWQDSLDGTDKEKKKNNGNNFIICDYFNSLLISENINLHDFTEKYELNDQSRDVLLKLIQLLLK